MRSRESFKYVAFGFSARKSTAIVTRSFVVRDGRHMQPMTP